MLQSFQAPAKLRNVAVDKVAGPLAKRLSRFRRPAAPILKRILDGNPCAGDQSSSSLDRDSIDSGNAINRKDISH
jgi:hypothetical protein